MTYRIGRSFTFAAAHHLPGLPEGHKCARLHGHTYTVEVMLRADGLDEPGFVTDFADLTPFERLVAERCDHRHLNDVVDVQPTSELLAHVFAEWFIEQVQPHVAGRLERVRVSESPGSWAEYIADAG